MGSYLLKCSRSGYNQSKKGKQLRVFHTLTCSLLVWQTALLTLADKSSNNLLSHTHLQPRGLADGTPRTCRQKFQ